MLLCSFNTMRTIEINCIQSSPLVLSNSFIPKYYLGYFNNKEMSTKLKTLSSVSASTLDNQISPEHWSCIYFLKSQMPDFLKSQDFRDTL